MIVSHDAGVQKTEWIHACLYIDITITISENQLN